MRPELSYDRGQRDSGPLLVVTEIAKAKCKQITVLVTIFLKFLTGLIKRTTKILLHRLSALDGFNHPPSLSVGAVGLSTRLFNFVSASMKLLLTFKKHLETNCTIYITYDCYYYLCKFL